MEMCYEYLGCANDDCIMQNEQNDNKLCWEVEGTLCNNHGIELMRKQLADRKKEEACASAACIYYKIAHRGLG